MNECGVNTKYKEKGPESTKKQVCRYGIVIIISSSLQHSTRQAVATHVLSSQSLSLSLSSLSYASSSVSRASKLSVEIGGGMLLQC